MDTSHSWMKQEQQALQAVVLAMLVAREPAATQALREALAQEARQHPLGMVTQTPQT